MLQKLGLFGLAVVLLAGCGGESKPPEYPVKGTVKYDGKPLEKGSIILDPADGQGGSAAGGIENGEFQLMAQPGKKIIRISASRETGEKDEYGEIVTESYIPDKYNVDSKLEIDVQTNEDNSIDLNLDK